MRQVAEIKGRSITFVICRPQILRLWATPSLLARHPFLLAPPSTFPPSPPGPLPSSPAGPQRPRLPPRARPALRGRLRTGAPASAILSAAPGLRSPPRGPGASRGAGAAGTAHPPWCVAAALTAAWAKLLGQRALRHLGLLRPLSPSLLGAGAGRGAGAHWGRRLSRPGRRNSCVPSALPVPATSLQPGTPADETRGGRPWLSPGALSASAARICRPGSGPCELTRPSASPPSLGKGRPHSCSSPRPGPYTYS